MRINPARQTSAADQNGRSVSTSNRSYADLSIPLGGRDRRQPKLARAGNSSRIGHIAGPHQISQLNPPRRMASWMAMKLIPDRRTAARFSVFHVYFTESQRSVSGGQAPGYRLLNLRPGTLFDLCVFSVKQTSLLSYTAGSHTSVGYLSVKQPNSIVVIFDRTQYGFKAEGTPASRRR
jgi:hypothetical protein